MVLIGSDRFVEHQPPDGHPERPDRARVMSRVARRWVESGGVLTAPRVATAEELTRVHAAPYVDQISHTAGQRLQLDPDTYTSDDSYEIALLAAGLTRWRRHGPVESRRSHWSDRQGITRKLNGPWDFVCLTAWRWPPLPLGRLG